MLHAQPRAHLAARSLAALPLLGLLLLAGCPGPANQCVPGESAQCFCADGSAGAQLCAADGTFGACSCEQTDGGSGDTDGGTDPGDGGTDGGVQRTPCEQLCFHVYQECEVSFTNTQGNPISESGCVDLCDAGGFNAAEQACFTGAECTTAALNACFGLGECPAIADCGSRECGPDPVCNTSCGSCGDTEACSSQGRCVAARGWLTEDLGEVTAGLKLDLALAVEPTGTVHFAWIDDDGRLVYAERSGAGAIDYDLVAEVGKKSFGLGQMVSLALDSAGRPHLAWRDEVQSRLRYAVPSGSSWRIETADPDAAAGVYSDLVLDADGLPHLGYMDDTSKEVRYARRDASGTWTQEVVDPHGYVSPEVNIALDAQGRPHLVYPFVETYPGPGSGIRHAWYDGSAWQLEEVTLGSYPAFVGFDLAPDDTPHVSFFERADRMVRHAVRTGGTWEVTDVDTAGDGNGWTCLKVGSGGVVHLGWLDTAQERAMYGRLDGGTWTLETVDTTRRAGLKCNLALSPAGDPWMIYNTTEYTQPTRLAHRVP